MFWEGVGEVGNSNSKNGDGGISNVELEIDKELAIARVEKQEQID